MSRMISRAIKDRAFKLWLQGYAYRDIRDRTGMSLGATNQMVAEAKGRVPDVEELRQLNIMLRKSDASFYDAVRGAKLLDMLNRHGVSLETLPSYIQLSEKISSERGVEAEGFIEASIRLTGLEAKTGKSYEEVVKDFEERMKRIEDLETREKSVQEENRKLVETKARLEGEIREAGEKLSSTHQELNKAVSTQERLRKIGLEKVSDLARFVEDYELLGFDANVIRKLAEWRKSLVETGVDPDELEMFIREKGSLGVQVSKLRATVKRMRTMIDVQEKRKKALVNENLSLFLVSKIHESKKASLPCRRCGWPISTSLERREDYRSMIERGLGLSVWCPSCGCQNLFDPREVIFNIGWLVLPS